MSGSRAGRRYRHAGHAQYWGRIIGTSADDESARYLFDRFKQLGLIDVRLQSFDLPPQWMPQTWTITATGAGKTVKLEATQPVYGTPATTADGLEAELVWAGTGTEADYLGRDVREKVVVITRGAGTNPRLAETRGALARRSSAHSADRGIRGRSRRRPCGTSRP